MDPESISEAYRNRYTLSLYYGLRVAMLGAVLCFFVAGDFASVFSTLLVLSLMSLPAILKHRYRFYLPFAIDFGIVSFVFATLFLGHLANFYDYIPFWDTVVHFQSGLILGAAGFVLVYTLNEQETVHLDLSPGFVAFFAVTFSLAIGVVWEIFEFVADYFFIIDWQDGNIDTMWDLIADGGGALIVSVIGYFWMHRQARLPFTPRFFAFLKKKLKKSP